MSFKFHALRAVRYTFLCILLCICSCICIYSLSSNLASAQSIPSDFDYDGKSDLTLIEIKTNKNLQWNPYSYFSGPLSSHGSFGKSGDHIIMGNWDGLSIGVIKEDGETGKVTWRIKNQSGDVKTYEFGTNKDLFVAGADVEGDGKSDAIVVEKKKKKLRWKIAPHPFTTSGVGTIKEVVFGKAADAAFFMDLDGDGDWIGVIAENINKKKRYLAKLLNTNSGEKRVINVGNSSARPLPVQGIDGKDIFAFAKKGSNFISIIFRNQQGKKIAGVKLALTGDDDGEVAVGDFTNDPGEEIAVQSGSEFLIYNPSTKSLSSMSEIAGILVDEININKFENFAGGGDSGVDGDGGGSDPANCGSLGLPDGFEGNLWKPNSDTQHYAVFVAHAQYTGKISQVRVYKASNNQLIKNLTYKSTANGNRTNWQDYSLTGSNYKSQYGSIRVRVDLNSGSCVSAVISDPSKRVD